MAGKTNSRIITVPVTLDSANRKKDKSVKFAFTTTREISTDEYMVMDSFHQSMGWLVFKENEIQEEEIPDEDVEQDLEKSMSVQIRDAIWVLYKTRGNDPKDKDAWNAFYKRQQRVYKDRILSEVHRIEEESR